MVVLTATQTTGDEFNLPGGTQTLILDDHAGGTWVLQVRGPGGNWIDTDIDSIAESGIYAFVAHAGGQYRITGGSAGAIADCSGAY